MYLFTIFVGFTAVNNISILSFDYLNYLAK